MRDYISEHSAELLRRQQKRKRWYRLLCVCACIVVFCTTYALILPAITLDQTVSPGGSVTISVGDTVTLQGTSGNRNIWKQDPEGCATIETSGTNAVVTGTAAGTVTITHTYTNKGVSETFYVTVEAADDENTEITASPDDSNYTVTVKGNKRVLTGDVTLHVEDYGKTEDDYSAYYDALVADLETAGASSITNESDFDFLHMYHIYLTKIGVDGEYVPEGNVNLQVTITYDNAPAGWSKVNWVGHYKKNGTTVSGAEISDGSARGTGVKQIKVSGNSITFHIQSFSVFPVAALAADTGDEGGGSEDSGTTGETDSSILTADLLSGTKNAWQIVDGKYEGNDSGDYKQVSETVRVQKNVIPTDVENEFLVYLSIDTKQLFEDFFASAEYEATSANNNHDTPLGQVVDSMEGNKNVEVTTSQNKKGPATFTIISSSGAILAQDIKLYWSQSDNYTMYVEVQDGNATRYIVIGTSIKSGNSEVVMLSEEAEYLIMSNVAQMAKLDKVTDVMGNYIEYVDVVAGDYETSNLPTYDTTNRTLTWIPKVKSNPTIDKVKTDEGKEVQYKDANGKLQTIIAYSHTSWALNTAELVYKVRLNVTKDGFNSAANNLDSKVGDSESYPVNNSATLYYGDNSTVDFQQPYVRGLLYDLEFDKVDAENAEKKLSGASFTVKDENGKSYTVSEVDGNPGTYRAENLPAGTYTLTEKAAPKGYQKGDPSSWTISLSYTDGNTDDNASVRQDPAKETNMIPVSGTGSTGSQITNEKIKSVYVDLVKTDMSGNPLSGAVFSIYDKDPTAEGTTPMEGYEDITVGEGGVIADNLELENGTYYLVEKKAPDGYVLPGSNITLTVDTTSGTTPVTVSGGDSEMTAETETETINDEEATVYVIKIENSPGVLLPATGGSGTWFYTFGGLGLILLSGLMYGYSLRRKRKGGSCDL